jgi:3-oxoacyl-[acyl-carrier protein] reductase
MIELGIKNKVAIVTGSSSGIGFAIADKLASSGVKVLLVSRNIKKLKIAYKKIKSKGGEVEYISADVSKISTAKTVVRKCLKKWKNVHILINNTGGPAPGNFQKKFYQLWLKINGEE